ncbi:MAG: [protein-PII] uridylyltransferase [Desulfobacterales bacterium]|nr:[protein-PII] uridylyltransferase [Desulfobacterales bacterium]
MPKTTTSAAEELRRQRNRLLRDFPKGRAPDFMLQHSRLLDEYFCNSFEASQIGPRMNITRNPYVIIAQGGYGRDDQCVHSDIDLLILFEKRVPDKAEALIREIVYPLWDLGLEVGHATRSLKECLSLAAKDFEILTPLLDARFVCGMSKLYSALMQMLREKVIKRRTRKVIDWLVATNQERHVRFGDSAYLLEPNLKEGQGGLRDYHTMLWIARIKSNLKQPRDFEYLGYLSHEEYQQMMDALLFIFEVRNRLHLLSNRKNDQLHFEHQIRLARALGYRRRNGLQPVEQFLGDLHEQMEFIKQQHLIFLFEQGYEKRVRRFKRRAKVAKVEGVEVKGDALTFSASYQVKANPRLLIRIFEESARLKLPLDIEARRVVREFGHLFDADLRAEPEVVKSFEKILMAPAPTFNVLNAMLHTGLLERFLPVFAMVINRIQYDEYHIYPVGRHLLRTVMLLKQIKDMQNGNGDPLAAELWSEVKAKKLLLWGALLHDIGKGQPGKNHSGRGEALIPEILGEKGYKPEDIETVAFLVREHLLLAKTAARRDINDEETALHCARRINDVERLRMLYLLTVADSMATGPKAWNSWTATLLRDLFFKVLNVLENRELATQEAVALVARKHEELLKTIKPKKRRQELEALFKVMSPRYLLNVPVENIQSHADLFQRLGDAPFVWDVEPGMADDTRIVTVCGQDQPGLFSRIAGVFTLNHINILDAQVFTWRNNTALDIFKVEPPPDPIFEDEKWEKARRDLTLTLEGGLDIEERLVNGGGHKTPVRPPDMARPVRVEIDNTTSSFFTIVEVFADDFPGLLFRITNALFHCRLDVWVAKIATNVDQVVDVFYVRDFDGQKVDDPGEEQGIKDAIYAVLPTEPAQLNAIN